MTSSTPLSFRLSPSSGAAANCIALSGSSLSLSFCSRFCILNITRSLSPTPTHVGHKAFCCVDTGYPNIFHFSNSCF
ncbi:hypothetical protein CENSYa_0653 [Cenarchaeum symbiosum A]|uniref:Uncharacterized protein n=1 Tax=Cenarchaeum symbiosum (strain A) TaxID=414004 RepID=A0RVB9_CENSY|nr:hypothetical protein CENSYa_0653 [Cenarchaeum symbiosum A]